MSNCLFEAAFENILERCKCAPGKHTIVLMMIYYITVNNVESMHIQDIYLIKLCVLNCN